MVRYIALWCLMLFLLCSCKHEPIDKLYKLFPDVTRHILEEQGYKRVWGIDVVMYEKQINGVLFQFQFYDNDGQRLGYQTWVYEDLTLNDNTEYNTKLRELGFMPMTPVDLNERVAINGENNGIYISVYYPKTKTLRIGYDYPSTK